MTEVPSAELLARYRQQDASAAEALFQRYVERLTQLARSRLSRKLVAREPTPLEAAALLDELRCVLAPLSPVQRRIVELRLQGHEVEEIATSVQRSARTVRRTLARLGEELERRLSETALPPAAPASV